MYGGGGGNLGKKGREAGQKDRGLDWELQVASVEGSQIGGGERSERGWRGQCQIENGGRNIKPQHLILVCS